MKDKKSFAEQLYILILLASYLFAGIMSIIIDKYEFLFVLIAGTVIGLGYLYSYKIYSYMRRDTYIKRKFFFKIKYRKLHIFMFVYLIIMIFCGLITGDGAAEKASLTSSSIFLSLWVPDAIFPVYYCMCREEYPRFTRVNTFIYVLYKILLGWTGILLFVAIFELYYMFKDRKLNVIKGFLLTLLSFFGGGVTYAYLYPLKYTIRYGVPFNMANHLSIAEGISKLANRIAHMEVSLFVMNSYDKISSLYMNQKVSLAEFKATFRPIIPSAIMHEKIFSNIGSCIYNAQSGYTGINITNNCGILIYYWLLSKCDLLSLLLCLVLFTIFLFSLKKMYNMFQHKSGEFNMLYFWILVNGYSICGTLENSMVTYIKFVFFIPLLWFLGIIKAYKYS